MACCHLVVPVKRLARAKTRLTHPRRAELALAFACDTVAAALGSEVAEVTVVTDEPAVKRRMVALGAEVVADTPDAGLNPALRHAAAGLRADCWIGALSADLPAARPEEFVAALNEALGVADSGCFVPDHGGGTTLLLRPPGRPLDPRFGPDSAAAHQSTGATPIGVGLTGLRLDVDTAADLAAAVAHGVGVHTRALLAGTAARV
jgi:2-phospho-L-lactate guanylyltransferase